VLTLTSLGLVDRTNSAGRYTPTRNIALWKDDTGRMEKIACGLDAQGALLTLGGEVARERTLDGRPNFETTSWRYQGHQPISLPKDELKNIYEWVVSGAPSPAAPTPAVPTKGVALPGTAATKPHGTSKSPKVR
jgi:hypothetical protein